MKREKKEINKIEASVKREASEFNINKVLIALSGGSDSVATAYAIKKANLEIVALHCNFHLRGEESDRDCVFVKDFCNSHSIPLRTIDFNIPEYLRSNKGISVEMACRKLRYEWFEEMLEKTGYDRIVTGHNQDDNIETLFLNMFRGSGTRGLKGMMTDTGKIWRPLLSFNKKFILDYLVRNNLKFVTDSTNLKSDYRRNYLRNDIIPLLRKEWKGFDSAMCRTISNIQAENKIVEFYLSEILKERPEVLSVNSILKFPAPELLIKRFIEVLGPFVTTPEEVMKAIIADKPHIRRWRLKKGELLLRNGNLFIKMGHGERSS